MIVKGKSLTIRVGGATIALSINCSCDLTLQTIEARTFDDAGAYEVPDVVAFTITSESLVGINDNTIQLTHAKLFELMMRKESVDIEVILVANASFAVPNGDWAVGIMQSKGFRGFSGQAFIKNLSVSGAVSGNAKMSVQLSGIGEPTPLDEQDVTSYVEGETLFINGPAEIIGNTLIINDATVNNNTIEL